MAGIGVRLNRILKKYTYDKSGWIFLQHRSDGCAHVCHHYQSDFNGISAGFCQCGICDKRAVFLATILYTFIFSLLTASPFNCGAVPLYV